MTAWTDCQGGRSMRPLDAVFIVMVERKGSPPSPLPGLTYRLLSRLAGQSTGSVELARERRETRDMRDGQQDRF